MTETRHWLIYKIIVLYCFLASARACMTFGDNPYIDLGLSIFAFVLIPKYYFIQTPRRIYASFFLALGAMYTMAGASISGYLAQFAMVFIPIQLIFMKRQHQIDLFEWLSKWYAILLLASFIWWILWKIGVPLPHSDVRLDWFYNKYGFLKQNYFLFQNDVNLSPWFKELPNYRFNGFFLEPGHMGTITSFFLYINKFDFKKWICKVYIIIILASLSAAAFALTVIGYCFYRYNKDGIKVIMTFLGLFLLIFLVSRYNEGNNIVNNIVFEKFTRESGAIDGRFSTATNDLFDQAIQDGSIIFGKGAAAQLKESAGYKVFLLMNGLFGAVITLMAYWFIQRIYLSRLGLLLFVLMIISFIQRVYCFWDAFLDPYILGAAYLKFNEK